MSKSYVKVTIDLSHLTREDQTELFSKLSEHSKETKQDGLDKENK